MNTKEKIQKEALTQFNAHGTEQITTRHIAKALDISQGNLHYHYPTKNAVITQLFNNFQSSFQESPSYLTGSTYSEAKIVEAMHRDFSLMHEYRFLFKDNEVVWRRLPAVKTTTMELFAEKQSHVKALLLHIKQEGGFREDVSNRQIDFLVDQFLFILSSWQNATEYLVPKSNNTMHYVKFIFETWLPYFVPSEKEKWELIL